MYFETQLESIWQGLQTQSELFDITLVCDDEQIMAHKFIISSMSPVFRDILKLSSDQHPMIYLSGVEYKYLKYLINFMYQAPRF